MNNTIKNLTQGDDNYNFANDNNSSGRTIINNNGLSLNLNSFYSWIFIVFFIVVIIGTCLNVIVVVSFLKTRRNGVLTLVLQISLVDAISSCVAILEVWSLKEQSWIFTSDMCPLFSGTEILTNTLILYSIISFNFHVISITNLHIFELKKVKKNPLTSCEDDESNECLVTRSSSEITTTTNNRSITIDYRKRKTDISVILPSILVWFTCLSLSIPNYTLSSTIKTKNGTTICAILDLYYGQLLQILLLIFRVLIPITLLIISLVVMLWKLYKSKYSTQRLFENIFANNKSINVQQLLVFNIVLTLCYFLTSFQRQYFYAVHVIDQKFSNDSIESFKIPPLHNTKISYEVNFFLSMLHYSSIVTRCLLYVFFLPKFLSTIRKKLFCCCTSDK